MRERREWRVSKQSMFVWTPNAMVFGIQQVGPGGGTWQGEVVHKRAVPLSEELDLWDNDGQKRYYLVGVVHHAPGHWLALMRGRNGVGCYTCSDTQVKQVILPKKMACSVVMYVKREFVNFWDPVVIRLFKGPEHAATVYKLRPHERQRVRMIGDARFGTSEETWRESKDRAQSDAQ